MAKSKSSKPGMRLSTDKGRFVKSCGYHIGKGGGAPIATRHYLGPVTDGEDAALTKFLEIRRAWREGKGVKEIEYDGRKWAVWADAPLATTNSPRINGIDGGDGRGGLGNGHAVNAGAAVNVVPSMTVGEAAKMYLGHLEKRQKAGTISSGHWRTCTYNLNRAIEFLGTEKPLSSITAAEVEAAVLAIAARPPKTQQPTERIGVVAATAPTPTVEPWALSLALRSFQIFPPNRFQYVKVGRVNTYHRAVG